MYLDTRKNKKGQLRFRFTYLDHLGNRLRYPAADTPIFKTREEAEKWARSQSAAMGAKKAFIEKKLEWKTKHYQFNELLTKFQGWQKERAPNSWKNNVLYLEQWVLHWFLNIKGLNNVNTWHLYFHEFSDWLSTNANQLIRGKSKPIAAGTINNILRTVNVFLTFLQSYNLIDPSSVQKTPVLPSHKLGSRGYKDIILEEELELICKRIDCRTTAEFLTVLYNTGMRFNELFGLPMNALFKGEVSSESLKKELERCNISYFGYLLLDSQPADENRHREADGTIKRKPLKSHKVISPKNSRIIPIRTKEVWNILATRYLTQSKLHAEGKFGKDRTDYMLFDELNYNQAYIKLREAYKDTKFAPKAFHACRHTFVTRLVGETKSFFLTRMITGHRKDTSFERYLHIYEQIATEAKASEQEIDLVV
jgi:integrase